MTWHVVGDPSITGKLVWQVSRQNDFSDYVCITARLLIPQRNYEHREALAAAATAIITQGPQWISESDGHWSVDLDAMRATIPEGSSLPAWVSGVRSQQPLVAPGFEFSTSASDGGRLMATALSIDRISNPSITLDFVFSEDLVQSGHPALVSDQPAHLHESLQRFFDDNGDGPTAFVMMKFGQTQAHSAILAAIRSVLEGWGVRALRADDREYHPDIFSNIQTYMHGCTFGIAVFERLEGDDFNPNVSLEVGYMQALQKRTCLLKDKTLKSLNTDLVGKLYRSFDTQNSTHTIPPVLDGWLTDWSGELGIDHRDKRRTS
jgi:hypothetical protein